MLNDNQVSLKESSLFLSEKAMSKAQKDALAKGRDKLDKKADKNKDGKTSVKEKAMLLKKNAKK